MKSFSCKQAMTVVALTGVSLFTVNCTNGYQASLEEANKLAYINSLAGGKDSSDPSPSPRLPASTTPETTGSDLNCSQLEGKIPGENQRISAENIRTHALQTLEVNGVSNAGLDTYSQDLAGPFHMGGGNRIRPTIEPGTALVIPFKTSASYSTNQMWRQLAFGAHPLSNGGVTLVTISTCRADFTSMIPEASDFTAEGNLRMPVRDNKFFCLAAINGETGSIDFGIGGGSICNLQPGKQYYINITGGFVHAGGISTGRFLKNGPYTAPETSRVTDPHSPVLDQYGQPTGAFEERTFVSYGGQGGAAHSWDIIDWGLRPNALMQPRREGGSLVYPHVITGLDSTYQLIENAMTQLSSSISACSAQVSAAVGRCLQIADPVAQRQCRMPARQGGTIPTCQPGIGSSVTNPLFFR